MSNNTFALVNGGWQPVVGMVAGKWQRWRMVHAGIQDFVDLQASLGYIQDLEWG